VVRAHEPVSAQPSLRAGRADRAAALRLAGDPDPGPLHARAAGVAGARQPDLGGAALPDAPGPPRPGQDPRHSFTTPPDGSEPLAHAADALTRFGTRDKEAIGDRPSNDVPSVCP